jgi:hypothetical protein
MKALRNFKRRALSHDTLALVIGHSNNPLKKSVEVQPNYDFTLEYIQSSRRQISWDEAAKHPFVPELLPFKAELMTYSAQNVARQTFIWLVDMESHYHYVSSPSTGPLTIGPMEGR